MYTLYIIIYSYIILYYDIDIAIFTCYVATLDDPYASYLKLIWLPNLQLLAGRFQLPDAPLRLRDLRPH